MKSLIGALFLFCCLACNAQSGAKDFIPRIAITNSIATGALIDENFEGTGAPSGWTSSGSPDWDSTIFTMGGSQNLYFNATAGYADYDLGTDYSDIWVRFMFTPEISDGTGRDFLGLYSSALVRQALCEHTSRDLRVTHGTVVSGISAVDCLTASALNYVWVHYVYDSAGGNGTLDVYAGSSNTRGAAIRTVTTGDGGPIRHIRLMSENVANDTAFDNVLVQQADPGNF